MSTATVAGPIVSERTIARIGQWMALLNAVVILVAAASSYSGLHALALRGGVAPALAWGFPVIIDGGLAAATVSCFYSVLRGSRARVDWFLILVFTGLSIAGNVMHADRNLVSVFVFASPPAIFAVVLHRVLHFRQQEIVREAAKAAAVAAAAAAEEERQRRAEERASRAAAAPGQSTRPVTRQRTTTAPTAPGAPVLRVAEAAEPNMAAASPVKGVSEELLDQARPIFAAEPGISGADLGLRLGRSDKTGRNLLRALRAEAGATETAAIEDLAVTG